jgi:putative hydrolase of the HAD superfamily
VFSPKAILFDFGGTLDANGRTWLERARVFHAQAGVAAAGERFDRAFYDSDDRLPTRHRLEGLDLAAVLDLQVRDTLENLGADGSKGPAIAAAWAADSRANLAASKRLLEGWKSRYRLCVVSNFYGNMRSMLRAEGLAPLFDVICDSGEVGSIKPDAGIFMAALEPLGLRPEQAVMVGDSLKRDMRGAEALGMPHAWLNPFSKEKCCADFPVLGSLSELDRYLPITV